MRTFYFSRISIPLWLAIWGFVFLIGWLALQEDFSSQMVRDHPIGFLPWVLIVAFLAVLQFGIHYRFQKETLIIKVGPFIHKRIRIKDVKSIMRSYDLIASPANSLKRLRISYDESYILISPAHEQEFIKYLKNVNPDINIYTLEKTIKF